MTKQEVLGKAQPLVRQLAKCFAVTCPEVHAVKRIDNSRYVLGRYLSSFPEEQPEILLRVDAFTIDILLHEFAHHLQTLRHGDKYGDLPSDVEAHGEEFFDQLWIVASHYYGNAEKYSWEWNEQGCPQTLRLNERLEIPPLVELLKKQNLEDFKDFVRRLKKERTHCKACGAATGDGRIKKAAKAGK